MLAHYRFIDLKWSALSTVRFGEHSGLLGRGSFLFGKRLLKLTFLEELFTRVMTVRSHQFGGNMKVRITVSGVLFVMLASVAFGQATNSADITGTITDATGAVIPGATITVQDLDKANEHVITSDGAGIYDSGPLVPDDRYTITYAKPGFASLQRGPMTLRVGVVGLNAQLSIGQTTQQVVVSSSGADSLTIICWVVCPMLNCAFRPTTPTRRVIGPRWSDANPGLA